MLRLMIKLAWKSRKRLNKPLRNHWLLLMNTIDNKEFRLIKIKRVPILKLILRKEELSLSLTIMLEEILKKVRAKAKN